jgi:hypothetical protein
MRKDGDYRPSAEVKLENLAELKKQGYGILFIVDDDPDNCEAFTKAGYPTLRAMWARDDDAKEVIE